MQKAEQQLLPLDFGVKHNKWRFRQFDVRQDGLVFWSYDKSYKTGERWVTWENAVELKNHRNWRGRNNPNKKKRWIEWYEKNKEYKDAQTKKWQKANKFRLSKYSSKRNSRIAKEDPLFAMRQTLRKRTSKAFKQHGYTERSASRKMLGCTWEQLKSHIEKQFKDGMCWENRSLWHIDHIIPLASAKSKNELAALCHYSNLQPLWAHENLSKGAR